MMRKRKDIREAYERVMPKTWDGFESHDTKLIRSAIKGTWRKLDGRPCPYKVVVSRRVRGLTRTVIGGKWVMAFNPRNGVQHVIHDLSHFIHQRQQWTTRSYRDRDRPHCDRHLEMERVAAEYVVGRFATRTVPQ